jgi:O-antigen/teichoic acid export membrane protein
VIQRIPGVGGGASRRLPAGVADAGMASLATFVTGLAAVNLLDDAARGAYAVFFSAFMLGSVIPTQLRYNPIAIVAVGYPRGERLTLIPRSLPQGLLISLASAAVVVPALVVTRGFSDAGTLAALAVTCGATVLLSPTQDHVRRMLHVDRASWAAATTSAVQLASVVAIVAVLYAAGAPAAWIPFGTLALANAISTGVGILLAQRRSPGDAPRPAVPGRDLWDLGSWLFTAAVLTGVTTFLVSSMVGLLAGPEALGYAEAARVVAQPVTVLGVGLTAVLAPRAMETALERDRKGANRVVVGYSLLIVLSAMAYLVLAGTAWRFNPMAVLVPAAYVVSGLVAVTVAANVLFSLLLVPTYELAAARKQKAMAGVTLAVTPLALAAAATAGMTEAFARPLSGVVESGSKAVAFARMRRRHYAAGPVPHDAPVPGT